MVVPESMPVFYCAREQRTGRATVASSEAEDDNILVLFLVATESGWRNWYTRFRPMCLFKGYSSIYIPGLLPFNICYIFVHEKSRNMIEMRYTPISAQYISI